MITLENLSKYYVANDNVNLALKDINLTLKKGEFVAITGESGSGKSTLLNVISGMDTYEEGEMLINGEKTSHFDQSDWEDYREKFISFIFQEYNIIDSYTVFQNVEIVLYKTITNSIERKNKVEEILKKVGLYSHRNHKATKLSGGQKQRVVIARALAKESPIILADEPTGNLDSKSGAEIIALLKEISCDKLVVIVTHNYEEVEKVVTRKIRIFDGQIVEDEIFKKIENLEKFEPKISKELKGKKEYFFNLKVSFKLALKNIFATPKKSVFLFALFFLASLALTWASNSMQSRSSDEVYGIDFVNTAKERVVIKKPGGFTAEDTEKIINYNKDNILIKNDMVLDTGFGCTLSNNSLLLPVSLYKGNIDKGALPKNDDEVFVYGYVEMIKAQSNLKELINGKFAIFEIRINENKDNSQFKISGYYDTKGYGKTILVVTDSYFEKIAETMSKTLLIYNRKISVMAKGAEIDDTIRVDNIAIDKSLPKGSVRLTNQTFNGDININITYNPLGESINTIFKYINRVDVESKGYTLCMNEEDYNEVFFDVQYSLFLKDFKDLAKTQTYLEGLGFDVFNPYTAYKFNIKDNDLENLLNNISTLFLMVFTAIMVYFVIYFVSVKVMESKKNDFVIMRSLGYKKKSIKYIIFFELLVLSFVAFMLVLMANIVVGIVDIPYVSKIFKTFSLKNNLIILILIEVITLFLSLKFSKKLFKKSINTELKAGFDND